MYGVPDQTYEALAIDVISVFGMSSICGCNLSMKADSFQQASLRQDAECIEAFNAISRRERRLVTSRVRSGEFQEQPELAC